MRWREVVDSRYIYETKQTRYYLLDKNMREGEGLEIHPKGTG